MICKPERKYNILRITHILPNILSLFRILQGSPKHKRLNKEGEHDMDFWDTRAGKVFTQGTVPKLIQAIEENTRALQAHTAALEGQTAQKEHEAMGLCNDDEKHISTELIARGIAAGVAKLIANPDGYVVFQIGEHWFSFDLEREELSLDDYKAKVKLNDMLNCVEKAVNALRTDGFETEFLYYYHVLLENCT